MVDEEESLHGWAAFRRDKDRATHQRAASFTQIETDEGLD